MKKGWEMKKLGELVNIKTGKLDANAMIEGGNILSSLAQEKFLQLIILLSIVRLFFWLGIMQAVILMLSITKENLMLIKELM